ncbi:MAG: acyl-CoA/acyl-ACP dehydrogenase [Deltaproteobacteria bacterium]|nr:acyl-CoA/acyl-ACP dehydrogenase [Deltaproteobacteria bacterium]
MDFRVTETQQELRNAVHSFCRTRVTVSLLHELATKGGFDRSLWQELAELGVFSLRRPEARGGSGLGMAEAVLVFEELGRCLAPGPLVWSHLAADLVGGAASGAVVVGGLDLAGAAPAPYLVEHRDALGVLLILKPDGVARLDPKRAPVRPVATPLDPLTPLHYAEQLPDGDRIAGADAARRLRLEGATLVAAQLLGVAEATLEVAVSYAKIREQFGRPIGSFQALKHMMADMFARQELARAAVYAAAATLDHPEVGDVERAVATAKLVAAEAAMKNSRACIQLHGGMGYTWEVPAHYYFKRTWVLESLFGTADEQAAILAEKTAAAP